MNLGVILPHTLLFGGVKRYLDIGNLLVANGHRFTIFTPDGLSPDWFPFTGKTTSLNQLSKTPLDALFLSEECFLPEMIKSQAHIKIFYVISKNKNLKHISSHKNIILLANSSTTYKLIIKKTGITPIKAFGGVDTDTFIPSNNKKDDAIINILTYGRMFNKVKGTGIVINACEKLYRKGYPIKLLLFDTPTNKRGEQIIKSFNCSVPFEFIINHPVQKNYEIFHRAHIFASAERKGGWSNTTAEAMACGIPVVATNIGTEDFLLHNKTGIKIWRNSFSMTLALKKLITNKKLRIQLGQNGRKQIEQFNWKILAQTIETYLQKTLAE